MKKSSLIALGGSAAMVAALLRAIGAFLPATMSQPFLQMLYLLTDVFILLGVTGLFSSQYDAVGKLGFGGFLAALIGILVIRSDHAFADMNLYPAGALLLMLGLIALGSSLRRVGALSSWIVAAWVLSVILGIAAAAFGTVSALPIAAGVLFAAGFFGAGYELRSAVRK
jgi:hypothetical protein